MFRGSSTAKIDEKGRLKIPTAFLALIQDEPTAGVFLTSVTGDSMRVYPIAAWMGVEQRLDKMPSSHPAKKKFLDRVNYFGQLTELDAQGRVVIPTRLREAAGIAGEVDVIAVSDYLD